MNNNLLNKKVAFLSLGCKVNSYETEAIKEQFTGYGSIVVDFEDVADIYVVNTCTVTNIADRKSRQMLHKARNHNPSALIVATGCYVQESHEKLLEEGGVNLLIGNRIKGRIAEYVNSYIDDNSSDTIVKMAEDLNEYENLLHVNNYERTRADIKIQDGCNQFCSYCIIPYARGRISSRHEGDIINEVEGLVKRGYKEVVLTGIHISSYGFDDLSAGEKQSLQTVSGRIPLIELLEKLSLIEGLLRIRLGSLEPRIVTEEFVARLSELNKVCPHFHLSLQSGCDTVLLRMNRKYNTSQYKEAVELLRRYYYKPSVTTDVITGFPGETEKEFNITCDFCRSIAFSDMHIFPYSKREGTKAAAMDGQLDNKTKQSRGKKLSNLMEIYKNVYEEGFESELKDILIEECFEKDGKTYVTGHTTEYVKVVCEGNVEEINSLVTVTMSKERFGKCILGFR
ncbi:MAG: tRNA (N(6)-L-threonylcarbamoyladenosine(37)-C(2))-methylthiotransferase MtaB [Clostridiales bacterium]|nr:tRNA (N(6)-L-threonylcarbamoyladenosine(37)-C(2))-methylthiotransferase MtaB [Clostridiales bacterium]